MRKFILAAGTALISLLGFWSMLYSEGLKPCYQVIGEPKIGYGYAGAFIEITLKDGERAATNFVNLYNVKIKSNSDLSPRPTPYSITNTLVCVVISSTDSLRVPTEMTIFVPPVLKGDWDYAISNGIEAYQSFLRKKLFEQNVPVPSHYPRQAE